jgi:1-acyl-sn-glycerol-3-phosphate acyltransferase
LLYYILRPFVAFLLKLVIKHISITGLENIPKSGPVILASNHSNSFFDALIICCTIDRRVWSLARGDVFKKKWASKLLSSLFMLPVHRLSEGKEYVADNDITFKKCIDLFRKDEIVLIFSEGICTHQTKLLPLKKGTARLARHAWADEIDLKVIPIGLTYRSFNTFGKTVHLNIGESLKETDFHAILEDNVFLKTFNLTLTEKLNNLLNWNFQAIASKKSLIFLISSIIHFPALFLAIFISKKLTKGTVFFDSITVGLLMVILPIYWLLAFYLISFLINIS